MKGRWKIYYSKRSFSSADGTPREAPFWDVQDIIQFHPVKEVKYHQNGTDYYIFKDGYWVGVDFTGLLYYLSSYKGEYIIKVGSTIPTDEWLEIFKMAEEDGFIR